MPPVGRPAVGENVHDDLVAGPVMQFIVNGLQVAQRLVQRRAQDRLGGGVRRDAGHRAEGGDQRHGRHGKEDAGVRAVLADQRMDGMQIGAVFLDRRDAEAVAVGVVLILGHGAPERIAAVLVVPDLRQAKGDDKEIGGEKDLTRAGTDSIVIVHGLARFAMPEMFGEVAAFQCPLKLLAQHERVHHPLAKSHHIGIAIGAVLGGQDRIIALCQPLGDVLGEARPKGHDIGVAADGRRFGQPTVQHEIGHGIERGHIGDVGIEIRVRAPEPAAMGLLPLPARIIGDGGGIAHMADRPLAGWLHSAACAASAASISAAFFSTCSTICSTIWSLDILWLALPAR